MGGQFLKLVQDRISTLANRRLRYDQPYPILSSAFQIGDLSIDPFVTVISLRDMYSGANIGRMGIEYRTALQSPFNSIGRIVTNDYQVWGHQTTSMELFLQKVGIQSARVYTSPDFSSSEGDQGGILRAYHDVVTDMINTYFPAF
jgi:hypothetical protein